MGLVWRAWGLPQFQALSTRLKSLLGQKQVLPSLINTHGDSPKVDSMEIGKIYILVYSSTKKHISISSQSYTQLECVDI
jgi:hypothetical protein